MDMSSSCRIVALALCGMVVGSVAAAQEPAAPASADAPALADPVLDALVQEALQANPDLLALQESVLAARARPDQARTLSDPMLSVVYTNDGWSPSLGTQDMTTLAVMGSQELPWPGKRRLRGDVAAREADQVEQQLEGARLGVVAGVKRAYSGLVLSRELLDLVREQEQVWKQIEGVARARYAVGQGAQPDVLRVQIEVTRVEQLITEQQVEAGIRVAELNRLTGRPATSPVETSTRLVLRPVEESLDAAFGRLVGISPELGNAAVAQQRASLLVALASKQFKPDFSVQAGYMNRGGLAPMWQAGVGISLPLYRKRLSSGLAEAEALARASARLAESVRLQLRFRTEERLAQLQATEKIARLYGQGIIPQGRMSVDAAVANYQSGKVPFIAVLEALTTLYADRATHLALLANHARIRASLEEASLDETSSMAPGPPGMAARGGSSLSVAEAGAAAGASMGSGRSMR
jgi:outer membrane protein TolC